ncbi:MAG TPA: hypothetical protein VM183_10865 [Burkholderiales bacterium]|nr:hypothetical protein [Burkholderiales bacterium]
MAPRARVTWEKRIKHEFYRLALAFLLVAAPIGANAQDLRQRVQSVLDARGLGKDVLGIISNVLGHEGRPPPRVPAIVDRVLRDPLAGSDAQAIFDATVPADLWQFAVVAGTASDFNTVLDRYIAALAEAQAELMAAVAPFDEDGLLRELGEGVPPPYLVALHTAVDLERLSSARAIFVAATARFVSELRSPAVRFPPAQSFDSAIGRVVIGSGGADQHASGAALIIDPGGDDVYERAPARGGAISVVIDLGGHDRYTGSDVAVHALSAIVDVAGNDRYTTGDAGLAAAIAGVSLLIDLDGDDHYEAGILGQGAAVFGWAALIDGAGNDRYNVKAFGQGYAGTAGVGLLWDRAGNDVYIGAGLPDPFQREGGIGFTQGAAWGLRDGLGGGIGILRDDAGDDRYDGQMFAQGAGYYYAFGLLWDRGGNDEYSAVRYAQGNGTHQAAALLHDESGNDRYSLAGGVGQGMGLDLAVGVLIDGAGDDSYRSNYVAQGSGTANGFGLLADEAGTNTWEMGADPRSWGHAQWLRGLPTVGVLLHDPSRASFSRTTVPTLAAYASKHEIEPSPECKPSDAVRAVIADPARNLGNEALPCALELATPEEATQFWTAFDVALELPGAPFLRPITVALQRRAGPPALMQRLGALLQSHPHCAPRALWAQTWASESEARAVLDSPCWRLQAAARERLKALGVAPAVNASTPGFLRAD